MFTIFIFGYIILFIITLISFFFKNFLKNSVTNYCIRYIEHELSNLSNLKILLSIIAIILFLDLLMFVNSFTQIYYNSLIVWILMLLIFIVIIIPLFILYDHGFYFLAFLRGSSVKKILI